MNKILGLLTPQTALIVITTFFVFREMAVFPTFNQMRDYVEVRYATKDQVTTMSEDIKDIKQLLIEHIKQK